MKRHAGFIMIRIPECRPLSYNDAAAMLLISSFLFYILSHAVKAVMEKIAFKMKRRKGYHRTVGHRQEMTRIKISEIKVK